MNINATKKIAIVVLFAFLVNTFGPIPLAHADDFVLPAPGVMVRLSPEFNPPILKGIKVHPENPFRFDFILDKGESPLSNDALKDESSKLIKYFLASLTIPEKDLWVNLSPYERDRIIPQSFGLTEMGRDLLAEDYMLKQITASLIYPEDEVGRKFWKRIYEEASKRFGTTNIPVNTFNKVWIVPEKAVVYENAKAGTAYVVESKLKVMLEQDYLSLQKHEGIGNEAQTQDKTTNQLGSQIVREIVIPELTKEVNEGKNFSQLRQVYNSLILATWYKKKIKNSILEQVYADKNKVAGVNIDDPQEKQRIYEKYLQAFKKGVYNYIKEDFDPLTQQQILRKYFSGGAELINVHLQETTNETGIDLAQRSLEYVEEVGINQATTSILKLATKDSAALTQVNRRLLPLTGIEHHDPNHFFYVVKMSKLYLINSSSPYREPYFSFSSIDPRHLATYGNRSIGLIADFHDEEVLAVLRHRHHLVVTVDKTPKELKSFLAKHRRYNPANIIYDDRKKRKTKIYLDANDILGTLKTGRKAEFGKNNELLIGIKGLKFKAVILIVRKNFSMKKIVELLDGFYTRKDSPSGWEMDQPHVLEAIGNGLPVVIVGEKGVDLNKAKKIFMASFPDEEQVSPSNPYVLISKASRAMTGQVNKEIGAGDQVMKSHLEEILDNKANSPLERYKAAKRLGQLAKGNTTIAQKLKNIIDTPNVDEYPLVKEGAAEGLSYMGETAKLAVPSLFKVVEDTESYNGPRKRSIEALLAIGIHNEKIVQILIQILNNPLDLFLWETAQNGLLTLEQSPQGGEWRKVIKDALERMALQEQKSSMASSIDSRMAHSRTLRSRKYPQALNNYRNAISYFITHASEKSRPDLNTLIALHKIIMHGLQMGWKRDSEKYGVEWGGLIRGSTDLIIEGFPAKYLPSEEVPAKIESFMKWFEENYDAPDPFLFAAEVYKRLTQIHVFWDGNGRTVRLFVDWVLFNKGYLLDGYSENYFDALRLTPEEISNEIKSKAKRINELGVFTLDDFIEGNASKAMMAMEQLMTERVTSLAEKLRIRNAATDYAKVLKNIGDRQQFISLVEEGKLEEARELVAHKALTYYQDFQLEPTRAIYPGGLDLRIFELFPNIDVAHFINKRPFRVRYRIKDLYFDDHTFGVMKGRKAFNQMLSVYLNGAAQLFVHNDDQNRIIYGSRYKEKDLVQIGMEPFIKADLKRLGAHNITISRQLSPRGIKVYKISFRDLLDRPKIIYYHEMDFLNPIYSQVLDDDLKARRIGLFFLKAFENHFSTILHRCPDRFLSGMSSQALFVTDDSRDMVHNISPQGGFIFSGDGSRVPSLFLKIGFLAGPETPWGRLGYARYSPMYVYRQQDGAMIRSKTSLSSTGGIDLTPANNVLQTHNNGDEIKFHMDPAMLRQLQNAPGFVPVVISIEPLRDLRGFLTGIS